MGILDRIAGTLDELTGDPDGEEIARAAELAEGGELAAAEVALEALVSRSPRAAGWLALGRLRVRRDGLEGAVTALGRAVDLDGDNPEAWYALGDALARLGRIEPARDALRRALTLGLDAGLRARAHAALGRVHGRAGQWTAAARAQRKALEIAPEDREIALDYGRTLSHLGEREAGEWLTRAARAEGGDAELFIEAADATANDALAERLLREGLARAPASGHLRAALARRLGQAGRAEEAIALAEASAAGAPEDAAALRALRDVYGRAGRFSDGLRIAETESRLGAPAPFSVLVPLALGAGDREALARLAREAGPSSAVANGGEASGQGNDARLREALLAFVERRSTEADLLVLGRRAPGPEARRFVARDGAPPAPPAGNLAGLLAWTHDLAVATPALGALAPAAGHALEALDRPLLVAVMGEFNAGKSSFVNALAGEEIAPTGVTPTTATVNALRYGATPVARVLRHDGVARDLPAADVARFLAALRDADASEVRLVEIFLPVETLRRVEIVDTPGLNSIRPEHERVARDFLQEADAIVWVFAIGQAAKATEREALAFAHGAGKRVLGVLNKVDRADEAEIEAVTRHVAGTLGDLVEAIVPFSATRALAARRAGKDDADYTALAAALDERFFRQALALKRATALSALRRFVAAARPAAAATAPALADFGDARDALARRAQALGAAVASERVALRARIDEAYRRAALEIREFVRPRAWLFGEHRATPADEAFLSELLEDAIADAVERTRRTLRTALVDPAPAGPATAPDPLGAEGAIDAAVDRFTAYARGAIEGGAVPDFFRNQLPRLRLDVGAIRDALVRRAPDPEEALFAPLSRAVDALVARATTALESAEVDADLRALIHTERLDTPLAALESAIATLEATTATDSG